MNNKHLSDSVFSLIHELETLKAEEKTGNVNNEEYEKKEKEILEILEKIDKVVEKLEFNGIKISENKSHLQIEMIGNPIITIQLNDDENKKTQ